MGFGKKFYKFAEKAVGGHGLGNFSIIREINAKITHDLKKDFAIVDSHKMFLDPGDPLLLSINGIYEERETNPAKQ